jgi:ABC-type phosphate/phosphonate transport system substrate-binding protein
LILFLHFFFPICVESKEIKHPKEMPEYPAVGYSNSVFTDVDLKDAQVVTKLWTEAIAAKHGVHAEGIIYDNLGQMENDLRLKKLGPVILLTDEYLQMKNKIELEPLVTIADENGEFREYVILTKKDGPIKRLQDLRHKSLNIGKVRFRSGVLKWLETQIMKAGYKKTSDFFSSVKESMTPSLACIPVFFNKTDACVVTKSAFKLMAELNPQMGKELQIVSTSPPFMTAIMAVRKDYSKDYKVWLTDIYLSMHTDPVGKQLFTLFRMNRSILFQKSQLKSVETLIREHRELSTKFSDKGISFQ